HNMNAVRTAHYPPHPELLELTDELGFWVMLENDLETHGFEDQDWRDNPSDDPRWRAALLDRIQRTFERDKNHPSIISWSLGNESGRGANLAAMASWLRRRDPERPVHYESDFDGTHTDLVSRMYVPVEQMGLMSTGQGDALAAPGRAGVLAGRPMILCEYVHAMGNGPGGITEYEDAFDTLPQWHGGFVWEWRDHGLRTTTLDGTEFFAYGGDFGEPIHDGSFICDGMVLPDGTPSPGLAEYKAVVAPIKLDVGPSQLTIENRRHDGDTADLRFVLVDEIDGHPAREVALDVPAIDAGSARSIALPEPDPGHGELWRTVRAELADDAPWAAAGHEVAFSQECLRRPSRPITTSPGRHVASFRSERSLRVGPGEFDPRTGDLLRLGELPIGGPRLTLWRAPVENDFGADFGSYLDVSPAESAGLGHEGPSTAARWLAAGLDRLQRRVVSVDEAPGGIVVRHRYAAAGSEHGVDVTLRYSSDGSSLHLDADSSPTARWDGVWARLGLHFELPAEGETAEWFGTGPLENYPDLRRAARVGRFRSSIDDLIVGYPKPQESGHRAALRELRVPELGLALHAEPVAGELPGFTLRRHDEHEVAAAAHPHELPTPSKLHLFVDVAQHGSGSRSCGPDVLPAYQLRPRAGAWSLRLHHGASR
ncbi:MAG: DUF4981 domain-containing protein, partial [Propionibacterium sp.]|nr:DUF4981 domain-containing protein [Propionibacterium sp.]